MIAAGLGIVAALAFVLGLGAFAVWALKRFSVGAMSPRTRVPVEVVQRIALGPKTGLAVVRVGERVMAVSVGDGGIRPLFELEESDRQRVIATSTIAMPVLSSTDAGAALARLLPNAAQGGLAGTFGAMFTRSVKANVVESPTPVKPANDFHAMLGMSLRNTTRLAVFAGMMVLSAYGNEARAQDSLAVKPPAVQPPAVTPPVIPAPPQVALPDAAGGVQLAKTARPVAASAGSPTAAARPRRGNGASTSRGGTAVQRPMSDLRLDSTAAATGPNARASAASPAPVAADDAIMRMMPQMDVKLGDAKDGGLRLNGTVGIVVMMGLLTLLPTLVLMMTGFTRILIVLHFLKQAMGTQGAPPAHLLAGLALLLTGFVMAPTLTDVNKSAITPWLDGKMTQVEMLKTGVVPLREFMVRQTRQTDIKTFVEMSRMPRPNTIEDVPLHVLMSAFVASELRTAFQIGFAIYLPFIIIDAVVASVLMSMGMFMLPPAMISLPFKLLLFVLVDGWSLTIQSLVQSFK